MKAFKRLSQNDLRWNRKRIGQTLLTIGGHGCLITCIAMACGKTPLEVEAMLQFTDNDHPLGGGLILWNAENKDRLFEMGLEYIGRYRSFDESDTKKVKELCKTENYIPIMEVRTRTQGRHWVLPVGRALTWRGLGWGTNDPWNGKREWKTVGFGAPYINELGWVLFKKIDDVSS